MLKAKSTNGKIEIPQIDFQENTRLRDFLKVYYLKYNKINEDFLEYSRKILLQNKERFTPSGELKVVIQSLQVLSELHSSYSTSLEEDEHLLLQAPNIPIRYYFALSNI